MQELGADGTVNNTKEHYADKYKDKPIDMIMDKCTGLVLLPSGIRIETTQTLLMSMPCRSWAQMRQWTAPRRILRRNIRTCSLMFHSICNLHTVKRRPRNCLCDAIQELGADETVDYTKEDFAEKYKDKPFDVIVDPIGGEVEKKSYTVLAPGGTYAHIYNE